jgi:hypothetical protein
MDASYGGAGSGALDERGDYVDASVFIDTGSFSTTQSATSGDGVFASASTAAEGRFINPFGYAADGSDESVISTEVGNVGSSVGSYFGDIEAYAGHSTQVTAKSHLMGSLFSYAGASGESPSIKNSNGKLVAMDQNILVRTPAKPGIIDLSNFYLQPSEAIQDLVDLAQPGDRITIGPGLYNENLILNKPLSLLGAGSGDDPLSNTILASALADMPVLFITAPLGQVNDGTYIKDMRVTGAAGSSTGYIGADGIAIVGNGIIKGVTLDTLPRWATNGRE